MAESFDNSSKIKGVGIDCTRISRFSAMEMRVMNRLAERILSSEEFNVFNNDPNKPKRLACYFCEKESVAKALGTGFRNISFSDIIIMKDDLNRPFVMLDNNALKIAKEKNITSIKISLTHEGDNVIAFAIAE